MSSSNSFSLPGKRNSELSTSARRIDRGLIAFGVVSLSFAAKRPLNGDKEEERDLDLSDFDDDFPSELDLELDLERVEFAGEESDDFKSDPDRERVERAGGSSGDFPSELDRERVDFAGDESEDSSNVIEVFLFLWVFFSTLKFAATFSFSFALNRLELLDTRDIFHFVLFKLRTFKVY